MWFSGTAGACLNTFLPLKMLPQFANAQDLAAEAQSNCPKAARATLPGTTTQNKLTWESVPGASGYEIQASASGDFSQAPIISVPTSQNQTVYNHESGATGTKFYYRIRATNGDAKSTWSAPIAIVSTTAASVYDQTSHTSGVNGWNRVSNVRIRGW